MKISELAVAERTYYLMPEDVEQILNDAAGARADGTWLRFRDAADRDLRVLIPSQALLEFRQYEVDEPDPDPDADSNHWTSFDFDFPGA